MSCMRVSEVRERARASTSSRTLELLSAAHASCPRSMDIWRLRVSCPSRLPLGVAKEAGPGSKS